MTLIMHGQSLIYTPSTELVAALNADAVLDSTIRPNNVPVHKTEPACIFLTEQQVGVFYL